MKRLIAVVLVLAMLLLSASALAAAGDKTILRCGEDGNSVSVRSMAYCGGAIYILTYDKTRFFIYRDGALEQCAFSDEIVDSTDGNMDLQAIVSDGEKVYLLAIENRYDAGDDNYTVQGAYLYTLTEAAGGKLNLESPLTLNWKDMIEQDGEYQYSRQVCNPFVQNGKLVFYTYGDRGENEIVTCDMQDGSLRFLPAEKMTNLIGYRDGQALMVTYDYDSSDAPVEFVAIDLESGDTRMLFTLPIEDYAMPRSLLYDRQENALYYVLNGELYVLPDLDPQKAQAVASIQTENWSDTPPILTEDKFFVVSDYQTVIQRNTDPNARADRRLTVYASYNDTVKNAYYTFADAHPDVDVVMTGSVEDVVQAMMNRSSSVDVYCLTVDSSEYSALYERGFLAELSGSQKLTDLIAGMYESVRRVAEKDGQPVAVPVEMYTSCGSYIPAAWQKAGLTEDDVPGTWAEFLDLLNELPDILEDHPEVSAFEPYYTQDMIRQELLGKILQDYMLYITHAEDAEMSFDTPVLRDLLTRLEGVDFEALGLPEEQDGSGAYTYESESILFLSYGNLDPTVYNEDSRPLILRLSDELEPMIGASMSVAFVNPYSENRELAVEFLENIELRDILRIELCPDENEPVRNESYETILAAMDEQVETLQAQLEKASDEEKAGYQQMIDGQRRYRDEYAEKYSWDASEESIARYRQYAEYLVVSTYFGLNGDNAEELSQQIQQYLDGATDANTLLKNIDKKLRMMLMEGM